MSRYEYLKLLAPKITDELVVTSIAGVSNEWSNLNDRDGNLYTVFMSGATSVALGLALALPRRRVISLDGDGSMLMGLTVLPAIANRNPSNLIVIVLDNQAYEAAGRIPTFTSGRTDLAAVARGAGISNAWLVREPSEFEEAIGHAFCASGTSFIQVKVEVGHAAVPWPTLTAVENKYRFARYIEKTEDVRVIASAQKKIDPLGGH